MKLYKHRKYQAPQMARLQLGLEDLVCEGIASLSHTVEVDESRIVNSTPMEGGEYEPSYFDL